MRGRSMAGYNLAERRGTGAAVAKVLIVDDEPDILLMLRARLESHGYETALAADGETALQRVADQGYDVMLLDVTMPVMDGWGVLDRLAGHPSPPRVVVVSAKTSGGDLARALQLGALDYLTKPFDPSDLDRVVGEILALDPAQFDTYRRARLARAGLS